MSERIRVNEKKKNGYDIVYESSFENLAKELVNAGLDNRNICIVTDSNVEGLYLQKVKQVLENTAATVISFVFPAGEEYKTLDTVKSLYEYLIKNNFERKDLLVALGGGVVGDLTGYTAATYLRGIDFIQVPTTLLAQVDSSIGGKTGVDFDAYKNMVGAFHMPKLVYTNLNTLKDLDDRQFAAGMAEVYKHGLIQDASYYEWLISSFLEINERNYDTLEAMVRISNEIKKRVVEKDPTEQGIRAILNFGHTIGHAIEKSQNFKLVHGECVALGIVSAAYLSWKRELLSMDEYYEIRDMLVPFSLPISIDSIVPEEIVALTKSDKKMENGAVKFVLLKKTGKAIVVGDITEEELLSAVQEIHFSKEDAMA